MKNKRLCERVMCCTFFKPREMAHVYCSKFCRENEQKRRLVEKRRLANFKKQGLKLEKLLKINETREVLCGFNGCDIVFETTHSVKKYCSVKCRRRNNNDVKKASNKPPSEHRAHYSTSKMLTAYDMNLTIPERRQGVCSELKAEVIEMKNAKDSLFSKEEYKEEMEYIAKKYEKTMEFILKYSDSLSFKKKIFKYKNTHPMDNEHSRYVESVYSLPSFMGI